MLFSSKHNTYREIDDFHIHKSDFIMWDQSVVNPPTL